MSKGQRKFVTVTAGFTYWKPKKKGDKIEGTFLEIMEKENKLGKKGDMQKFAVLVDDENNQIALPSHFGITGAIEKGGAGYYRITCLEMGGKSTGAKRKPYKYNVEHAK